MTWKRTQPSADLSTICWLIVRPTTKGPRYLTPKRTWTPDPEAAALFSLDAAHRHAATHKFSRPTRYPVAQTRTTHYQNKYKT
jgi:hypothetical protein